MFACIWKHQPFWRSPMARSQISLLWSLKHTCTHAINQTYIFLSVPADLFVSDTDFSMTTCNSFPLLQKRRWSILSILHKIMKNKCAIIMKIKKQNKIQFYTCYLGPIQTDIHKLLVLLYYRTYTIFNLVPEMRLMSSPNSIVHFPIETLQIYSCTFAWSKIITRHLNASRLLSLILACFYKWNRVEVPEETSLKAQ